jgi:hypothetical protein
MIKINRLFKKFREFFKINYQHFIEEIKLKTVNGFS